MVLLSKKGVLLLPSSPVESCVIVTNAPESPVTGEADVAAVNLSDMVVELLIRVVRVVANKVEVKDPAGLIPSM